jgi:hypothetical protein
MQYLFGLYEATFALPKVGSYSGIIRLLQYGGLKATYYKTIDFQAPVYLANTYDHKGS